MATGRYFQVTDSFSTTIKGVEVEYQKGEVVDIDDPIIKKHAAHFGPLVVRPPVSARRVEQATSSPGEERS